MRAKRQEWMTPVAAACSACATLLCCLPLGFAGALGAASLGAVVVPMRPWLLTAAVALLIFAVIRVHRRRAYCRTGRGTAIVLWVSAILVFMVAALPQVVATVIADLLD